MVRPLVAISCYVEPARWGVWAEEAAVLPATYFGAVEAVGGRALVVPPTGEGIDELLNVVDAVILSGGADIDPALYGGAGQQEFHSAFPDRDHFEMRLATLALERDMPLLGICRGMQILNVARGGDLVQDLSGSNGALSHKEGPGVFARHDVEIEQSSQLGSIVTQRGVVSSHHHQAPGRIGRGLRRVAWSPDGTTEAIEDPDARFVVGVLWHPEQGEDRALFKALVQKAIEYREVKR